MKWIRVTRANRCPICDKPDWCSIGEKFIHCMRVPSGKPAADGGYLHPLNGAVKVEPIKYEAPREVINATKLMREWRMRTSLEDIKSMAKSLGVAPDAMEALGVAYAPEHRAWAFPMKNQWGDVIGVRLRNNAGRKWAVTGSRAGLIYSQKPRRVACITEGPTDCAAALTLGLEAIGRPSCLGTEDELIGMTRHCHRVLLIVDNDQPGWNGALHLQERLRVPSLCWSPPAKDLREFLMLGGTLEVLNSLTQNLLWKRPK